MIGKMIALDWRAMKYYQIRGLLLPFLAAVVGIVYTPILVIPMSVFFATSFSVNPFAVEEKGELNNLYLTLPIRRNQIILGRYALSFLLMLAAVAISTPIMLLSNKISFSKFYVGAKGLIALMAISFLLYSIFNLFTFPILFRLGYQKGKMWGFYLPVILFGILLGVYMVVAMMSGNETLTIDFISSLSENLLLASGVMILSGLALLFGSYLLSVRLYSKRDF